MLSVQQNGESFVFNEPDTGLDVTRTFYIVDGVAVVDGVIVKDDGSDGGVPLPFPEPFPDYLFDCMTDCFFQAESDCGADPAATEMTAAEPVVAEPVVAEPDVAEPVMTVPTMLEPVVGTDLVEFSQSGDSTITNETDGVLIRDDDGNTFVYSGDPGSELILVGTAPEAMV